MTASLISLTCRKLHELMMRPLDGPTLAWELEQISVLRKCPDRWHRMAVKHKLGWTDVFQEYPDRWRGRALKVRPVPHINVLQERLNRWRGMVFQHIEALWKSLARCRAMVQLTKMNLKILLPQLALKASAFKFKVVITGKIYPVSLWNQKLSRVAWFQFNLPVVLIF